MKPEGPLHMAILLLAVQYWWVHRNARWEVSEVNYNNFVVDLAAPSNIWEVAGGLLTNSNGRDSFFSQSAFRLAHIPDGIIPESCSLEGIVVEPLN